MNGKVAREIRRKANRIAKEHGSPEKAQRLHRVLKKAYKRREWDRTS
jgi:hypothetical protein